jgi:hypothetical protein
MEVFSYQGIANYVANLYMETHGTITYYQVSRCLGRATRPLRPKLAGFDAYRCCGYKKAAKTCNHPAGYPTCPVPTHDLRRGSFNQAAYSFYSF